MAGARDHGGFGVLMACLAALLAALSVSLATARLAGGVAGETQALAEGRRALEVGRSCLSEAVLDFRSKVNARGEAWYKTCRAARTSERGLEHWLRAEYDPLTTRKALPDDDVQVAPVRVSVWRDFPIDPAAGPYDEKFALLTLTADISVRPEGHAPFAGVIRRQVQRSYHLKQVRISPEPPFDAWTLYVHRVPQLATARDAYDDAIRAVAARREKLLLLYRQEIDEVIQKLEAYLTYMRRKVRDWDRRRHEIGKTEDARDRLVAVTPFALGLTLPAVAKIERTLREMKEDLRSDLAKNLTAFGLADEQTFRRVASDPYPPSNLRADLAFDLELGSWPEFRGYAATPEGLVRPGPDLARPVVADRASVTSREIDYQLPPPPDPPVRPTYSVAARDIRWLDAYSNVTSEFRRYMRDYRADLQAFIAANAREFERHEGLFRLLPADPPEYARHLTDLGHQARRASWFFEDQDAFLAQVVAADGVARLDGIYAVRGDLTRFPARFSGRGRITVEGEATLGPLTRVDPRSTLVVYAGRDAHLAGTCEAAVQAPSGRVRSAEAAHAVSHCVVGLITRQDEFTVMRGPASGDSGIDGLWVNVAPAPLAETLLRE